MILNKFPRSSDTHGFLGVAVASTVPRRPFVTRWMSEGIYGTSYTRKVNPYWSRLLELERTNAFASQLPPSLYEGSHASTSNAPMRYWSGSGNGNSKQGGSACMDRCAKDV